MTMLSLLLLRPRKRLERREWQVKKKSLFWFTQLISFVSREIVLISSRIDLSTATTPAVAKSIAHELSSSSTATTTTTTTTLKRQPLCWILDKALQAMPLESMPLLRLQSVFRLPSLSFVIERAQLGVFSKTVKMNDAYYVLNPSGDLVKTEGRGNY